MSKKLFISLSIILFIIFSFTLSFAADDNNALENAVNNVRNFVGDTENNIENAAMGISNTSKDVTGNMANGIDNHVDNAMGSTDDGNNGDYTTTRLATDEGTFMGMTSNAWTWIIVGIAAIAIIALIWYYSMQYTHNNNNND